MIKKLVAIAKLSKDSITKYLILKELVNIQPFRLRQLQHQNAYSENSVKNINDKNSNSKADFRIFLKVSRIKIQQSTHNYIKTIQTSKYFSSQCNQ